MTSRQIIHTNKFIQIIYIKRNMHNCVYKDTLIDSVKKCMFCRLCVERRDIVFKKTF